METNNDLISRSALLEELEWLKANVNESSKAEVEEYIQRVKNAPAVTEKAQWIPTTERLPEHGKVCLICARYNEMFLRKWDAIVKMWIGDASQYDFPASAVTHWMLRPVPPKEGAE